MAEGAPVVVSDLGALPDLVQDGKCGEVFRAGDAQALAGAIKRLLERANYRQLMELYRSLGFRVEGEKKRDRTWRHRSLLMKGWVCRNAVKFEWTIG